MRIAIVTNCVYRKEPEYVGYTDGYKRRYCDKWGIDYLRTNDDIHPDNPPAWSKPAIMLRSIRDYDWLVWMDADAAPVDMDVDIKKFLSFTPRKIIMQKHGKTWNSGVFALPNDERCIRWMEYIEGRRNMPRYQRGLWEQYAMTDSFKTDEWNDIPWNPPYELGWNCCLPVFRGAGEPSAYEEGRWCIHVFGQPDNVRNRIFRNEEWIERRH